MRRSYNGNTSAFQAEAAGSIPARRSIFFLHIAPQTKALLKIALGKAPKPKLCVKKYQSPKIRTFDATYFFEPLTN